MGPVASMTGSGTAVLDHDLGRFEAEARSVNHRFLKTSVRTWGPLPPLDAAIEAAVRERVQRGHVSIHLRFTPAPARSEGPVNADAFTEAARLLSDLARTHGLEGPRLGDVLRLPGVLADVRSAGPVEDAAAPALEAVGAALAELAGARLREGAALADELRRLAEELAEHVAAVEARAPEVPARARDRLLERLTALLADADVAPDPAQVAREAALLADRADVREEVARLEAHLAHMGEVLDAGGPVGRRLDFLVQELHRETTTIGSKTQDLELGRRVLDMKAAVERLREQVQNLE